MGVKAKAGWAFLALVVSALVVSALGCAGGPALTPRLADAAAPHDFYRTLNPGGRKCQYDVPLLRAAEAGGRPYRKLSALSATCYPGAPSACEQTLTERACELHADAVILDDGTSGGTPPGASDQSAVSLSGRAVKWDAP